MSDTCKGCKWWEPFNWVCCNGDSHHCADFVNCGCKYFEREDVPMSERENTHEECTNGVCSVCGRDTRT